MGNGQDFVASQQQTEDLAAQGVELSVDIVVESKLALAFGPNLQPGDGNQDLQFNQFDIILAQQGAKYRTGRPATWPEGDWDAAPGGTVGSPPVGDGIFDQRDIIAALRTALYRQNNYAAENNNDVAGETTPELVRTQAMPKVGDVNLDGRFDRLDLQQLIDQGKYGTGVEAQWSEGDWNADSVFDELDLVEALAMGNYLQGPHAAVARDVAFAKSE